jgi:hypothetical protein
MKNQVKKNYSYTAQRSMIVEMINASLILAEKLGRHPLTKGCNCIGCIHKRKRILQPSEKNWKFKL